jgi:hypothetical protein
MRWLKFEVAALEETILDSCLPAAASNEGADA